MPTLTPEMISYNVFVIQVVAGLVGLWSLSKAKPLIAAEGKEWITTARWAVFFAIVLPFGLFYFDSGYFTGTLLLRVVAVFDLFLLFGLLWLTGGPIESWFTPFLLAVTPLGMQLELDLNMRWVYLLGTIIVFTVLLEIFNPLHVPPHPLNVNVPIHKKMHHGWYFTSTCVAVFFPTMIALRVIDIIVGFVKKLGW